jgi:hypothetical protein
MVWEDPIVAEVRRVRESLAAQFEFDVAAIFADMRRRQESLQDRLVRLPDKREAEPMVEVVRRNSAGSDDGSNHAAH